MDNKTQINLINTNARSLRPKIASFVRCFFGLALTFAIITETWLASGSRLEQDSEDMLLGHGLSFHYLNRVPGANGVAHGGVAVVAKNSCTKVKAYQFLNPEGFEVLPLVVTESSILRKFYIIAAYIPPNYPVPRGKACLNHIKDLILDIKNQCPDPYIVLGGDFNQWDVKLAVLDYPDIEEVLTPPTRLDRHIDKIFLNWHDEVTEAGCLSPLETSGEQGEITYSDHRVQYVCSRLPKKEPIRWEVFSYRPYTEVGGDNFVRDVSNHNWDYVVSRPDANTMSVALQQVLDDLTEKHFPLKTIRRKESDLPWLDDRARSMIKKKAAVYKAEGNSPRWKKLRENLDKYLEKRQESYLSRQREKMTGTEADKQFFKNVRAYKSAERPKQFDVRSLRPGQTDAETAAEVATYFNRISAEFQPLEPADIPATYHREIPLLTQAATEQLLTKSRKTTSRVPGDIFPQIVNRCAPSIAIPLTCIYNHVLRHFDWPVHWKREFVTVIPKKSSPEDFSDLRNISCTLMFSKVLEQYVLKCLEEEMSLKPNQYGGVKGCSTAHLVVEIMQQICENSEDYRSATVLCAIDYSKAFNRLSFQHCLEAFRKKGASSPTIRLLATFLSNRTMSVRVGETWSEPLHVTGGCPQGSILGVKLFNTTTDDLEDDFIRDEYRRLSLPVPANLCLPPEDRGAGPTVTHQQGNVAVASTPCRGTLPPECQISPLKNYLYKLDDLHVQFNPRVANVPVLSPVLLVPPEESKVGTQVLAQKPVLVLKYIDDNVTCEKVNFGEIAITSTATGDIKLKQVLPTQNAFRTITTNGKRKGMVVNASKTKLICISDSLKHTPKAFFLDTDGTRVDCGDELKLLGFNFSDKPTVSLHLDKVAKSIRQRYWSLRHLRSVGFTSAELVRVYMSSIRPLAEYCCPAFHSMMTDEQDQLLENAQVGALRAIFGYGLSARKLRQEADIETLRQRRIDLTDRFARKAATSSRFAHWFPKNEGGRAVRHREEYKEFFAKTDRLKNSPLYYMRRRLNGKEGKIYGERNRQYRENLAIEH